ncbi:MAG: hypothetical protein PHZ26_01575 [Candidatus Gracilibacteria bacterium]|nr:hypothetical protein [Candidatus Gracilibacteria bacterium]MDD2908423.1 hypothetical protein [Candidatus Gracilibacteria bacterium]
MKDNFKEKIFSKIEKEKIEPIPESYFANKNRILWILIGIFILLAILFGGFLIDDFTEFFGMGGYRGGNTSYFLVPNIFWILLISFLVFIGIKSLRNTSVGYRASYTKDILIGVIIIFAGSYMLRWAGLGSAMHSYFVNNVPVVSNILYNESTWNNPDNGRLAGTIIGINDNIIKLKSINGTIWNINLKNSFISPMINLNLNEKIRILGNISGSGIFDSERVMPWFGQGMGMGNGFGKGGGMMGNGNRMMR